MARAVVDLRKTMHQVTLHVTLKHKREMSWRAWLAARLVRLAGWVMGCAVDFVSNVGKEEITCPACNGMPIQIDRFDHSKTRKCTFCNGKGKISLDE